MGRRSDGGVADRVRRARRARPACGPASWRDVGSNATGVPLPCPRGCTTTRDRRGASNDRRSACRCTSCPYGAADEAEEGARDRADGRGALFVGGRPDQATRFFFWLLSCRYRSRRVVNPAPSSATKTAISSAGSVLLALAEMRWIAPGGSKNDCPTPNVSSGPPLSCERTSPLVI